MLSIQKISRIEILQNINKERFGCPKELFGETNAVFRKKMSYWSQTSQKIFLFTLQYLIFNASFVEFSTFHRLEL